MNCDAEVMDFDGGAVSFYEQHQVGITVNQDCTQVAYQKRSSCIYSGDIDIKQNIVC